VPASDVKSEVKPVWGNYPEAIKALTADEKDKARPLSELIDCRCFR